MKKEIFISRKIQTRDFRNNFLQMLKSKNSRFLFGSPNKERENFDYSQLFIFYGEGGLGKTSLINECIEIATRTSRLNRKKVKIIKLDWDDYYFKKSTLPNTSKKMLRALYTVFTDEKLKVQKYFSEYKKIESEYQKIRAKVSAFLKDDSLKIASKITGAGIELASDLYPIPAMIKEPIANSVKTGIIDFLEFLQNQKTLSKEELDLYENFDHKLGISLVKSLYELSKKNPILLVIDTYERVDNDDIDEWMRKVFLSNLFQLNSRVMVILSGRNDHLKEYRNDLPEELLYPVRFDDILFTPADTGILAQNYKISLSNEQTMEIERYTKGVPIVVKDTIELIAKGANLEEVLLELTTKTGNIDEVIKRVVERFLKYCNDEETKIKIFHLAMLRQFDDTILSKLWNKTSAEVWETISNLSSTHSFIIHNKMHSLVKYFVREYLITEMDIMMNGVIIKGILEHFGKVTNEIFLQRLSFIETRISNLEERYSDERYLAALQDYFNSLLWYDHDEVFLKLPNYLLECLAFNEDAVIQILSTLNEFKNALPGKYKVLLSTINKGIEVYSKSAEPKTIRQLKEMFDLLSRYKGSLSEIQKEILSFYIGRIYFYLGQYKSAKENFDSCPKIVKQSNKFRIDIAENYFAIGNVFVKSKSYSEAIKLYKRSLALRKDFRQAWNNIGVVYFLTGDADKAIIAFKKLIELKANSHEGWMNLISVYLVQNKVEEAEQAFQELVKTKPYYLKSETEDNFESIKDVLEKDALEGRKQECKDFRYHTGEYGKILEFYIDENLNRERERFMKLSENSFHEAMARLRNRMNVIDKNFEAVSKEQRKKRRKKRTEWWLKDN